jgi:hypothetical protein
MNRTGRNAVILAMALLCQLFAICFVVDLSPERTQFRTGALETNDAWQLSMIAGNLPVLLSVRPISEYSARAGMLQQSSGDIRPVCHFVVQAEPASRTCFSVPVAKRGYWLIYRALLL